MNWLHQTLADPEVISDIIVAAHFGIAFAIGLTVTGLIILYGNKDS